MSARKQSRKQSRKRSRKQSRKRSRKQSRKRSGGFKIITKDDKIIKVKIITKSDKIINYKCQVCNGNLFKTQKTLLPRRGRIFNFFLGGTFDKSCRVFKCAECNKIDWFSSGVEYKSE